MGKILGPLFSTFGNRAIGAAVVWIANLAAKHAGLVLDAPTQTALSLALYGVVHSVLDKLDKSKDGATAAPAPTAG